MLAVFVVEEIPIPIGDGVVEVVNLGSDEDTVRAYRGLAATGSVVVEGIEVLLHVGEEQRAVGCGSDGQRQVDGLGIGRSRTGVGGDYLVIDVDFATDVPVVCRCSTCSTVASRSGIAVVDNLLRIVDEVAGRLVGLQVGCAVLVNLIGDSSCVAVPCHIVRREDGVVVARRRACAMLVLGIDIAAAETGHHVDKVELTDTSDKAPNLIISSTLLGGQFKIDTRGKCHLVHSSTVVALALSHVSRLPLQIGLAVRLI